jgi:hypothetical protein
MTVSEIYWPYVAFGVGAAATLPVLYFRLQRRSTWIAYLVALANLVIVFVNGAAPIRGLLDPGYVGYGFGYLTADKGIAVALIAGSVVIASALSASIAIRNRPGATMLIVAATAAFHIVNVGFSLLDTIFAKPEDITIQFGEYLTVPHPVAIPAIIVLVILPFLLALPWALQRAIETE